MRKVFLFFALLAVIVSIGASGCNDQEKAQNDARQRAIAATTKASALYNGMDVLATGQQAEEVSHQVVDTLRADGADLSSIGISPGDLYKKIQDAYYREALEELDNLKNNTTTDFAHAENLQKAFLNAEQKSGRPLSEYKTSEQKVNRYVARCFLAKARQEGGVLKPADFHAAGLPVPKELVVKYRQRPMHHKHLRNTSASRLR